MKLTNIKSIPKSNNFKNQKYKKMNTKSNAKTPQIYTIPEHTKNQTLLNKNNFVPNAPVE